MSKQINEIVMTPSFTKQDDFANIMLTRYYCDAIDLISSVSVICGDDTENLKYFLSGISSFISTKMPVKTNCCQYCGCDPCCCSSRDVEDNVPAKEIPISSFSFDMSEGKKEKNPDIEFKVGDKVRVLNPMSALKNRNVHVSSISKDGSTIRVKKDTSDSEEFEFTPSELSKKIQESVDIARLKYIAGIR